MAKKCVTHVIVILMVGVVVIYSGNGEFQKAIIAESLTTFDHTKMEKAIADCVEECRKLHAHDRNKMRYCILTCIDTECTKHYPSDENKMYACRDEFRVKYFVEEKH
ncbi:hypothetical protein PIB30_082011 [Stylosanthes scabra]|uniref:Uncharacterized protein n=1 Tax=Stylosanthes scabra TaxID=79078 RepID=A0ABU6TRE9_9FABA|nr:hypothetical protein [Stylosanthes scabra]